MLAFLDPNLYTFCHAGHDLHVVPTEAQLLGHQARDAPAQDGLSPQGGILVTNCQGPGEKKSQGKRYAVRLDCTFVLGSQEWGQKINIFSSSAFHSPENIVFTVIPPQNNNISLPKFPAGPARQETLLLISSFPFLYPPKALIHHCAASSQR